MTSPAHASRKRTPRRKHLLAPGAVLLGLVLAGVALVALVRPSALAEQVKERAVPALAQHLGREVSAGRTTASWFPPAVQVHDVRIAGGPGEPPLLTVESVKAAPRLWPLLRSRGRQVELKSLELRRPSVVLVRRADGTTSLADLQKATGAPFPPSSGAPRVARELSAARLSVVEGEVRLLDRSAPGREEVITVLTQARLVASGAVPGQPLELKGTTALASASPGLKFKLSVDPMPANRAALRAHPPRVRAVFSLDGAHLDQLQALLSPGAALPLQGGEVSLQGEVTTGADGVYQGQGKVRLTQATFQGRPAKAEADWSGVLDAPHADAAKLELARLHLEGLGGELSGSAEVMPAPLRVELALRGDRVDLAGVGAGNLKASDLELKASFSKGVLSVARARAGVAGGTLVADGSEVDLTHGEPSWSLRAVLDKVDMAQLAEALHRGRTVEGTLTGPVELHGHGTQWSRVRAGLTGQGEFTMRKVRLTQLDLGRELLSPVSDALRAVGLKKREGPNAPSGHGTALQDLKVPFTVADGWVRLKQPLELVADFGRAELGGRIGLDERLDLTGSASLRPEVVAQEVSSPPSAPLQYPLSVGGTLAHPLIQAKARPDQLVGNLLSAGGKATGASAAGKRAGRQVGKLNPFRKKKP